jgi:hypothetical protein
MRESWKMAALLVASASLGLSGCAADTAAPAGEPAEEVASCSAPLTESGDAYADEAEDDASPEALMSAEDTDEAAAALPIRPPVTARPILAPPRRLRPPLCGRGARRVRVPGGGYECRGIHGFESRPFCERDWRLIRVGRGFMCEQRGFPLHHPIHAEEPVTEP